MFSNGVNMKRNCQYEKISRKRFNLKTGRVQSVIIKNLSKKTFKTKKVSIKNVEFHKIARIIVKLNKIVWKKSLNFKKCQEKLKQKISM